MSKVSISRIILVTVNEISEEQEQELLDNRNAESLEEVADEMSETVEAMLAHRIFADADKVPLMSVETDIEAEYNEEDYEDLREQTE